MKRLIIAFTFLFGTALWGATVVEEKTFDPKGLQEVSVENINGDITVIVTPGSALRLKATKEADTESHLKSIEVKTSTSGGTLLIQTEHARSYIFGFIPLKTGGHVDYRLEVPPELRLTLDTVNGDIKVSGPAKRVNATTVNGDLDAEAYAGDVHLESVNGSIKLTLKDALPRISLETVNGSVSVVVPDDLDAKYSFETVSGDIRFIPEKFKVKGSGPKNVEGLFGSGKGQLSAETVNGTITIRFKGPTAV